MKKSSILLLFLLSISHTYPMQFIHGIKNGFRRVTNHTMAQERQKAYEQQKAHLLNKKNLQDALGTSYISWDKSKITIIESLTKDTTIVDTPKYDTWGFTPLCEAASQNDLIFAEYLLKKGANPNDEIKGVHSSRPIFFAESLEMAQLLIESGADTSVINEGQGVTKDMNLLHASIGYNTKDCRLFDYFLKKGFNPYSLDRNGNNLWHNFVWLSMHHFSEKKLFARAHKLNALGVNPNQLNNKGESAIDLVKEDIKSETANLNSGRGSKSEYYYDCIAMRDKMQNLLNIMQSNQNSSE